MPYTLESEAAEHGRLSPGSVKDQEVLLRGLFHPEHIQDGELVPAAIPSQDLSDHDRGYSVDRYLYAERSCIEQRMAGQQANRPETRVLYEIAKFTCQSVREILDENNRRGFVVIDQAQEDNQAHTCIYSAYERSPSAIKRIRSRLLALLNDRHHLDDLFSSEGVILRKERVLNSIKRQVEKISYQIWLALKKLR